MDLSFTGPETLLAGFYDACSFCHLHVIRQAVTAKQIQNRNIPGQPEKTVREVL
jgi:hypothetical protein